MSDDATTPAAGRSGNADSGARPDRDRSESAEAGQAAAGAGAAGRGGGRRPRTVQVGNGDPEKRKRTQRRWIIGGIAGGAALVILLGCLAVGALLRLGFRVADAAESSERRHASLDEACVELETRLNRLVPPGATGGDPGRRAAAIRDENVAVRLFLTELEDRDTSYRGWDNDPDGWVSGWRMLVAARTAYANALDRQVTAGEPAFFVVPKGPSGRSVVESLERTSPDTCEGAVRRLGHPDI